MALLLVSVGETVFRSLAVMVGFPGLVQGITVKSMALVAIWPLMETVIRPVVAPVGTVVVIELIVLALTVAAVPLNFTSLLLGVELKLVPLIVTTEPNVPVIGLTLVIVGGGGTVTVKSFMLKTVSAPT